MDNRVIRVDWDIGFTEGRQYGRGTGGLQWRDVMRKGEDPERPKLPQNFMFPKGGKNNPNNKEKSFRAKINNDRSDSESGDEGFKRKKLKQN